MKPKVLSKPKPKKKEKKQQQQKKKEMDKFRADNQSV